MKLVISIYLSMMCCIVCSGQILPNCNYFEIFSKDFVSWGEIKNNRIYITDSRTSGVSVKVPFITINGTKYALREVVFNSHLVKTNGDIVKFDFGKPKSAFKDPVTGDYIVLLSSIWGTVNYRCCIKYTAKVTGDSVICINKVRLPHNPEYPQGYYYKGRKVETSSPFMQRTKIKIEGKWYKLYLPL